jgi:hypothetical protein
MAFRPPRGHAVFPKKTSEGGARELTAIIASEDAWRSP